MMMRRQQNLFLTWSGFTSSSKKWRGSESSVNESEAVYHHDRDEAYEPSTSFELADSESELDRHALVCSLNKVHAVRAVIVTRAECSYASNETETVCSSCIQNHLPYERTRNLTTERNRESIIVR